MMTKCRALFRCARALCKTPFVLLRVYRQNYVGMYTETPYGVQCSLCGFRIYSGKRLMVREECIRCCVKGSVDEGRFDRRIVRAKVRWILDIVRVEVRRNE